MAEVKYHGKTVSDAEVRRMLESISDLYGKTVHVFSGDRSFVPKGGSTKSLHLHKSAADFHVETVTLGKTFHDLKIYASMLFDSAYGYEVIWHGPFTQTGGPHVHLGRYPRKKWVGDILFKTEGLTKHTRGKYDVEKRPIRQSVPTITIHK